MGQTGDLSDCECGLVAGARTAALSIAQTAGLLGFYTTTQPSPGFTERKSPVSSSGLEENDLLTSGRRGGNGQ